MASSLQAAILLISAGTLFGQAGSEGNVVQEGQRIALPAHDATLTFVEKKEDSRCPTNVVCIWQGRVRILLEFARSGQAPVSFEMGGFVGPDGKAEAEEARVTHEAFGLRFTLVRLDPYPVDGAEQAGPVRATIQVETLQGRAGQGSGSWGQARQIYAVPDFLRLSGPQKLDIAALDSEDPLGQWMVSCVTDDQARTREPFAVRDSPEVVAFVDRNRDRQFDIARPLLTFVGEHRRGHSPGRPSE